MSWTTSASNRADISFIGSFRRGGYPGTDPDGSLAVGDVFEETIGGTTFDYGDGTVNSDHFKAIAINKADDFVIATMVDDTLLHSPLMHQYSGSGPWSAGFGSCCNIAELNNNSGASYGDTTSIGFTGPTAASPVSSLAPIVDVGASGVQTFPVPAVDPLGRTLRWSLTDPAESQWTPPPGLTISPTTGVVSWETTGLATGLWSVSVSIDALVSGSSVSSTTLNFLIRVTNNPNQAPAFIAPTPAQNQTFTVNEGSPVSIPVKASDADAGDTVHIDHLGLPTGATLTSTNGNPANATFAWTPPSGSAGDYLVSFTAQDNKNPPGSAVPRTITIKVVKSKRTSVLTLNPALADVLGLKLYLNPSGKLTTTSPTQPLAGKTVAFSIKGKPICTATTKADGTVGCTGLASLLTTVIGLSRYDATFAGDNDATPASGSATLIKVGSLQIP